MTTLSHQKIQLLLYCKHFEKDKIKTIHRDVLDWIYPYIKKSKTFNSTSKFIMEYYESTYLSLNDFIGIKIQDTILKSISGPVSFYYLKPIVNDSSIQYFPLLIFFGDYHFSKKYNCKKCTCIDKTNCCYTISDPSFLQLLDTLPDKKHPIDFYTETFLFGTGTGFEGGYMEDLTTKNMISCYHPSIKNTNVDTCYTKNIRWHAGDVRDAGYTNKHSNVFLTDLIKSKHYPANIFIKFKNHSYIEYQFDALLTYLYHINLFFINKEYSNVDVYIKNFHILLSKSVFKNKKTFISLLTTLLDTKHKKLTFSKFTSTFFSMMNLNNSLIYKQIAKQQFVPFKNISFWSSVFEKSIIDLFETHSSLTYTNVIELLYWLDIVEDMNTNKVEMNSKFLYLFTVYTTTPFLDIYTLTRIFKKPTNDQRSSLSFIYVGNDHILNMINIVKPYYKVVHSIPKNVNYINRCLNINFKLDLTKDIVDYNKRLDVSFKKIENKN